jgi:hypothetical protein
MNKITINNVKDLQKHDRIMITYLNKDGKPKTKNTRFYGVEGNIIIVYQPRKQKQGWEIPEGTECEIKKIN